MFVFTSTLAARPQNQTRGEESGKCEVRKEVLPLTMRENVGLIHIAVNHKTKTFLLDPAGRTIINSDRLKLPRVRQLRAGMIDVSGVISLDWEIVKLDHMTVGMTEVQNSEALARTLQALETQIGLPLDGILGNDVLMLWNSVSLDFEHGILLLERSACKGKSLPERQTPDEARTSLFQGYEQTRSRARRGLHP
jgi:hypothetical protein